MVAIIAVMTASRLLNPRPSSPGLSVVSDRNGREPVFLHNVSECQLLVVRTASQREVRRDNWTSPTLVDVSVSHDARD